MVQTARVCVVMEPRSIRRAVIGIIVTFVVTGVVSTAWVVVVGAVGGSVPGGGGAGAGAGAGAGGWAGARAGVLLVVEASCIAAAFAAMIASAPVASALLVLAGDDHARRRRFAAAVFRGRDVLRDEEEQRGAVQWAAAVPVVFGFQVASLTLLHTGLCCVWIGLVAAEPIDGVERWSPLAFVVVVGVLDVWFGVRIRRARRYVRERRAALRAR
jgi:amino acid transporter